ncbi:pyridoxal phosphate-dependent decarboxylase family protein [Paracoccus aestuariivivens]|uniref:Amino acid decarboxylase n=1 Tax=Paracoccus aestuariivivens TaxID=1820333 RepID=A0A6L6J8U9_9RHOB|nr:pyridoxal-dependent decarboxylase [Paracoccus aestuariivivens]MTH77916.1 amino acid decarboxylase [Paracoccus aestuariivivens]
MAESIETLDPGDWTEYARIAHEAVDRVIARTAALRHRAVWQPMPEAGRAALHQPLPRSPTPLSLVVDEAWDTILAYPMGNTHPRFWMWYMGASNLTGALADFLAAADGSNLGGGNHAAVEVERQVIVWLKDMMGFPASASGTLTSGGSVANLIGLAVARNHMAGGDIRQDGVAAVSRPMRIYASDQVHGCHQKAVELLGLGNGALCRVPSGADCRIDLAALEKAIGADRAEGFQPICIIGNAGTVNTGAIDDLAGLAELCRTEGLWFHIDGCIGALARLCQDRPAALDAIELADSLALDPHKGLHAPFDVGCVLVRDARLHLQSFALHSEYLDPAARGIAAGGWLFDYGLQTSRGFRALKVWMTLKEHGADRFGRILSRNIAQSKRLAARVDAEPRLKRLAPVELDIVCFRYEHEGIEPTALAELNSEVMMQLQEQGIAAFSDTTVHDEYGLRAAICNHRTTDADLDMAIDALIAKADALARVGAAARA